MQRHEHARGSEAGAEPVDLPDAIVRAQLDGMTYSSLLGTISRVVQPSLRDFLR